MVGRETQCKSKEDRPATYTRQGLRFGCGEQAGARRYINVRYRLRVGGGATTLVEGGPASVPLTQRLAGNLDKGREILVAGAFHCKVAHLVACWSLPREKQLSERDRVSAHLRTVLDSRKNCTTTREPVPFSNRKMTRAPFCTWEWGRYRSTRRGIMDLAGGGRLFVSSLLMDYPQRNVKAFVGSTQHRTLFRIYRS